MSSKIAKYAIITTKYAIVAIAAAIVIRLYWFANYTTTEYMGRIRTGEFRDSDYEHMIAALFLLFAPLCIVLFIKLYKLFELKLDERILFVILSIPFAVSFTAFINHNIYDGMRAISLIRAFFWNTTSSVQIITTLFFALFVSFTLRKEKENIEYLKVLAVLYILTGIFQTMNNAAITVYRTLFARALPIDRVQSDIGTLLNYMTLGAALYTFSFLRKYLPKFTKHKEENKHKKN